MKVSTFQDFLHNLLPSTNIRRRKALYYYIGSLTDSGQELFIFKYWSKYEAKWRYTGIILSQLSQEFDEGHLSM